MFKLMGKKIITVFTYLDLGLRTELTFKIIKKPAARITMKTVSMWLRGRVLGMWVAGSRLTGGISLCLYARHFLRHMFSAGSTAKRKEHVPT